MVAGGLTECLRADVMPEWVTQQHGSITHKTRELLCSVRISKYHKNKNRNDGKSRQRKINCEQHSDMWVASSKAVEHYKN